MTASSEVQLTDRFEQALSLAARWHARQRKKGSGVPYIAHLLGVASLALEFGADEDGAIAALLHDALEDGPANTGRTPEELKTELRDRFGPEVVRIVQGCTDAEPGPGQPKAPWGQRKTDYLAHLKTADASILLVSCSDKLYNARAILLDRLTEGVGEAVFGRFTAGKAGTLWYYRALADQYAEQVEGIGAGQLRPLVLEFERTVAALERAAGVTPEQVLAFSPDSI